MLDAKGGLATLDLTGPAALRPFVVKGLVDAGRTVLVVAATVREAEDLTEELSDLVDPATVALYPAWETLPHERLSPRSDTVGRRLAVLRRLRHPGSDEASGPVRVVVAPVRSVLQPQVKGLADLEPVELRPGDEVELDDVVARLVGAAYSRVDLVEKRGEFAVRGGIVDVFPPIEEHPLRVEFFGDEVDEIRTFAVADQRTMDEGRAPLGAAVPRAPAHRRRTPPRRRARPAPPPAARDHRQARRGHGRRGDGVVGPGARRRDGAARRAAADRQPRPGPRPRAGAHPRARPGRHQRGVPRRQLGRRGEWRHGADRPRRGVPARARRRARRGARARTGLVGDQPVRARPRRR